MVQPPNKVTIEISYKSIIFIVAFILGLFLLFALKSLLIGLFISILFTTALNPLVKRLQTVGIPRTPAVLIVYLTILSIIIGVLALVIPPLLSQTISLLEKLPLENYSSILGNLEVNLENINLISGQLGTVLPFFKIISSTFSGVITFFTFSVITFYLLVERELLPKYISDWLGTRTTLEKVTHLVSQVDTQIGSWVRGQLLLMVVIGIITYIGLTLLQIPYALPLAILAGCLEIIPNIGPTIAAIPAIIIPVLMYQNPVSSIFVTFFYILVQQLENNLIVPKIMHSAVGIHPLITILLILVGLQLSGVFGAILSVPVFLVSKVIYLEVVKPLIKSRS